MIEIGGAEVLRHASYDFFQEFFGCRKNAVGRGDSGRCEVFMLVKNCYGDVCGVGIFHPHGPGTILVKRCAQDKSFAAVFGNSAATFRLVVDEGFYADKDEGSCVVVMWAVHVGIGRDFGVCFGLA